jgi:hypothetical protein
MQTPRAVRALDEVNAGCPGLSPVIRLRSRLSMLKQYA